MVAGVHAYDLSLPLAGSGLLLAQLSPGASTGNYAVFVLSLLAAVLASGPLPSFLAATPGASEKFYLVGPTSCVLAGIALIAPSRIQPFLATLVVIVLGAGFGMAVRVYDPTANDWRFAVTLVAVALWLVTVPFLIGRRLNRSWFVPASRIAGSWLVAIGVLLASVLLIPK